MAKSETYSAVLEKLYEPLHCGLVRDVDLMVQLGIKDTKTVLRMIADGDLPAFSFGSMKTRIRGWHVDVLRRHFMERYEQLQEHIRSVG